MEYLQLTSMSNPIIKSMKALKNKKARSEQSLFLAEGRKIIFEAINSGLEPETVFFKATNDDKSDDLLSVLHSKGAKLIQVSDAVMHSASDAKTPQDILASIKIPEPCNNDILKSDGLFLALDHLQDPGNMGAMLRSADAMGVRAVIISEESADLYSPKCIRSAMGSTFHMPVFQVDSIFDTLSSLKQQNAFIVAADLNGNENMPELSKKTVLMIGNEGNGLSPSLIALSDYRYRLAMRGRSESLNAAVCAGILLYVFSNALS